jgi:peptidyl-prolyl cis-trans isomerase C
LNEEAMKTIELKRGTSEPTPAAANHPVAVLVVADRRWTAEAIADEIPHDPDDAQQAEAARRAFAARELLLARAVELGLDIGDDEAAIGAVVDRELALPQPTATECRRYFDADPAAFASPVRFEVEHILFAVVPGVPIDPLRGTAEAALFEVREQPDRFAVIARERSNCPSGSAGGALGWLSGHDCVPEFFAGLVAAGDAGVIGTLVRSRHGFHVVRILARAGGEVPSFDEVAGAVAQRLRTRAEAQALRQYVSLLAGRHRVEGCDLGAATTPLVQ